MRESSLVPTNLLDWPRCEGLLPDQRLILLSLWSSRYLSCAGIGMYPIRPAASSLGLSPEALDGGLDTLETTKLIERDNETGEIFILDWFRFHHFKTEKSKKMLDATIRKIASVRLKALVSEKSMGCLPTTTTSASPSSSPPTPPTDNADPICGNNEGDVGGGCFGIPAKFHMSFCRMTKGLDPQIQVDVADEFVGKLLTGRVKMPEGLLRKLVAAANDGTLTLDNARLLRQKRESASRVEAIRGNMTKVDIDPEACAKGLQFFTQLPGKQTRGGGAT